MTKLSSAAQAVQEEIVRRLIVNSKYLAGTLAVVHAGSVTQFECTFTTQSGHVMNDSRKEMIRNLIIEEDFKDWLHNCLRKRVKWPNVRLKVCPHQESTTHYVWLFLRKG
ncbi:MAG: hypothetical protein NUW00_02910 [Candidatus Kaiserbacteria bacterium]|nr:hypothetical protein [Candidatus Kaiserbacteria bacterium]